MDRNNYYGGDSTSFNLNQVQCPGAACGAAPTVFIPSAQISPQEAATRNAVTNPHVCAPAAVGEVPSGPEATSITGCQP